MSIDHTVTTKTSIDTVQIASEYNYNAETTRDEAEGEETKPSIAGEVECVVTHSENTNHDCGSESHESPNTLEETPVGGWDPAEAGVCREPGSGGAGVLLNISKLGPEQTVTVDNFLASEQEIQEVTTEPEQNNFEKSEEEEVEEKEDKWDELCV